MADLLLATAYALDLRNNTCASSPVIARLDASTNPAESTPQQDRNTVAPFALPFLATMRFRTCGEAPWVLCT